MLGKKLPQINTALPGPLSKAVIEKREKVLPRGVGCSAPTVIKRGEGAMFEDLDGNIFMDWVGGIGVLNVGHCHPEVVEAAKNQLDKYFHAQINVVHYPEYIELSEKISEIAPVKGDNKKTFFANSGAECLENAVKFARRFTGRSQIVTFNNGFHGRTLFTLAMTSKVEPYKTGIGPFPGGVSKMEFPYMYRRPLGLDEDQAMTYYKEKMNIFFTEHCAADDIAAIVVEPVLGEGGFVPVPIEYVKELRKVCDDHGIMLIADEVQSGYCRTGKMFASNYWAEAGAAPDIMTSAKSIAAGLPLSAVTARAEIMDACNPGEVGGTYCGNPVAAAASLKTIEVMERDKLADRAMEINAICMERFEAWKNNYEMVGDVRGLGAMLAIEFVEDKVSKKPAKKENRAIIDACAKKGLILQEAAIRGNAIRFLMPLVLTDEQLVAGLDIIESSMDQFIK